MTYATSWPLFSSAAPTPVFKPAPRFWQGNLCGVRVPGLPPVPGGADDSSLVLSWFYSRYSADDRARIRQAWKERGYTHVVLSWPDDCAFGISAQDFTARAIELIGDGFFPCVFWCSKDFDPPDVAAILANIEHHRAAQSAGRGGIFADYWKLQVGKLTGLLHQRELSQDMEAYWFASGGLVDILQRFAGNFFCPPDSGFGHPFDLVAWEITAQPQFNGDMSEQSGDAWGSHAINCPAQSGPAGVVIVQGSGNGNL